MEASESTASTDNQHQTAAAASPGTANTQQNFVPVNQTVGHSVWLTGRTGIKHHLRRWLSNQPGPVVLHLHGIQGHSLWFASTASYLAAQGITVYALDRRGAGLSLENRGHLAAADHLIEDIADILQYLEAEHIDQPVFLIGNCWGAKVAVACLGKRNKPFNKIRGLILTSPALSLKLEISLSMRLHIAWLYFTGNNKTVPVPLTPAHFTNNPYYLRFIEEDPLKLMEATPAFYAESTKLSFMCQLVKRHITVPVLVLQSGQDRIVRVEGIKNWFKDLGSQDKEWRLFPEAAHSLDFEENKEEYCHTLVSWIKAHTTAGQKS